MKDLYKQLINAPFMPVSMETVFGTTSKERSLSLYNDYVFFKNNWSAFSCYNVSAHHDANELKIPDQFCIKNFSSRYLASIDSMSDDSPSVDIPVFCEESAVTLPATIGDPFPPVPNINQLINESDEDDENYDEDEEADLDR